MKKGYVIIILLLLIILGVLGVLIYRDLFSEDEQTNKPADITPFTQVAQEIEDSKLVGGHLWVLPDPDGEPVLFRYDQPFDFTAQILKENKAACLYTTYESDYVTFTGYFELYYEDGWQVELENGKPLMHIEQVTYRYDDAGGVYTDDFGTYVNIVSLEPSLDPAYSQATLQLVYNQTLYDDFICDFDVVTGEVRASIPSLSEFVLKYNPDKERWDVNSPLFAEPYFTKTDRMPDSDNLVPYTVDFRIQDESGKVWITGQHVAKAEASYSGEVGGYVVALALTEEGKELLAQATNENLEKKLSVYLEAQLIQQPTVTQVIANGECMLTGFVYYEDAQNVAQLLQFAQ